MKNIAKFAAVSALSVLALTIAAPLSAQDASGGRWQEMSDADLGLNANDFWANPSQAPCTRGVAATGELRRRYPETQTYLWGSLIAQSICAIVEERWDDATRHFREFESYDVEYNPFLGLQIATGAQDVEETHVRLRQVMLETEFAFDDEYSDYVVSQGIRLLNEEDRQDDVSAIAYDAFKAGRFETLGDAYRPRLANSALRNGDALSPEHVVQLLDYVTSPSSNIYMLASREYQSIWPQIEAHVGPNLSRITGQHLTRMRAGFEREPDSSEALSEVAYALVDDGQYEAAATLLEEWRGRDNAGAVMDEYTAWAADVTGHALNALGRTEEADLLFDEIAAIDEQGRSWVVNFAINRAMRLVWQSRWEEGLVAIERAREVEGSTYAQLIVTVGRVCALERLGRREEAEEELIFVRENADAHYRYAGAAMMCLGYHDEVIAMFTEAFSENSVIRLYLPELQPASFSMPYMQSDLPNVNECCSPIPRCVLGWRRLGG